MPPSTGADKSSVLLVPAVATPVMVRFAPLTFTFKYQPPSLMRLGEAVNVHCADAVPANAIATAVANNLIAFIS